MKKILFFILIVLTVADAQNIPNLPEPRCSGAAEVVDDKIYFFGGANRHYLGSTRYNTIYQFDGGSWISYDSIPDINTLGMGSVVTGTDVYLFGGYRFGDRVVRKYDVPNKKWSYMNQGPFFSTFGSAFEYANNHVYAFLVSGTVYEYDLVNDTWLEKTPNEVPGFSLSSAVFNDEVYIVGYYDTTFSHPFYKYTPATDSWSELANLPYQVAKCAMEVIGDKIYCIGGSEQGGPTGQFDTLLVYDISSDTWSIDQYELNSKRVWMASVVYNNRFLVLGGIDTANNATNIVEEILPLGPLPVELISLSAVVDNGNVILNWTTASEQNNNGFELQRRFNHGFITIGFVKGNGTTTEIHSYSFTDSNLTTGYYTYRLKQVDFNGNHEYSEIMEVEIIKPLDFYLSQNYPNPFNPTTKIKFSIPTSPQSPLLSKERGRDEVITLKVYGILGNEIAILVNEQKSPGTYEVEFNANNLPSGIYFYKLQSGNFSATKKLILLK